ncbi:MAG: hypothetical protein ACE5KM_01330 [Planctomycetaceae bacterium]
MARHEADREDLMAEATALVRRVEMSVPGCAEPVVVGIRDDDRFSIYFGQDRAYHFDADGRLRRAYRDGLLFRTQGSTLARLQRDRGTDATQLRRTDLTEPEFADFRDILHNELQRLRDAIGSGEAEVLRCVRGDAGELRREVPAALDRALDAEITLAPPFAGRR